LAKIGDLLTLFKDRSNIVRGLKKKYAVWYSLIAILEKNVRRA